jgi:uncharacterized protein YkwD/LysM repeat protein
MMSHTSKPFRLYRLLFLVAMTALLVAMSAQGARAQDALPDQAQQVLTLVNQARANHGLPPLALLVTAAQSHVDDMATNHNYSHTGSDGSSVRARARRLGYASGDGVSENWVSTSGPESALEWWMNSYVHRGNILNSKWHEIGVGTRRDPNNGMQLFVLVFGGGQDGTAPPEPVVAAKSSSLEIPAGGLAYTVQGGDTLSGIAVRYGIGWEALAAANGLGEYSVLQVGQALYIPGAGAPSTAANTGGLTMTPGPEYMVQRGDTLISIALRHEITWQALAFANGLSENAVLQVGQLLRVPGTIVSTTPSADDTVGSAAISDAAPAENSTPLTHVVGAGDTVISIAQRYGLAWGELLRINGLGENTILNVGQVITLR